MNVDILERSLKGAHFAIMAETEGNVAPSQTPIKARRTMTGQGKSSLPTICVESGNNKLKHVLLLRSVSTLKSQLASLHCTVNRPSQGAPAQLAPSQRRPVQPGRPKAQWRQPAGRLSLILES